MLKKYEIETMIINAFEDLDGKLSKPDCETGKCTLFEATSEFDENGDIILTFKEDFLDDRYVDKYRVHIELL